jgi:hypothetical protein
VTKQDVVVLQNVRADEETKTEKDAIALGPPKALGLEPLVLSSKMKRKSELLNSGAS